MAPQKKFPQKLSTERSVVNSPAGTFVTLNLQPELLKSFGQFDIQIDHHIQRLRNQIEAKKAGLAITGRPHDPPDMRTRNAWATNLANQNRASATPETGSNASDSPALQASSANKQAPAAGVKGKKNVSKSGRRQPTATPAPQEKKVSFAIPEPDSSPDALLDNTDSSRESSAEAEEADTDDKENEMADKPKLKLRMSSISGPPSVPPSDTPASETPLRTPAIKLSFKPQSVAGTPGPKTASPGPPGSSGKKRKIANFEPQVQHAPPGVLQRKPTITLKTKEAPSQTPITPGLKLKTKGRIPRRPLGVGYDSELDEREADPVILEGFILRMQPGPDCDYVRSAIENGTIGVHRLQGGAHVNMRFLDTQGRRVILHVRDNKYAASMVDLPCIIEGMKSWDKKGFIKSIDVCQMLLVLGPCKSDDEARLYPLPDDVNPTTYQYAHGITAPMKWVRKRRFERFQKTRVDDIEAIDKRVKALLDADTEALDSTFNVLDYDPRKFEAQEQEQDEEQYSEEEEVDEEEDEDEDEEEDADGEAEDYFGVRNGTDGINETPGFIDTPQEEIDDEQVDEFERMLAEVGEDEDAEMADETMQDASLLMPDAVDSSFAVTSTSASPSAANANTPASAAQTSDDDDDDDDEEKDDDEKDDDENVQQTKDKIADLEERIKEQTELLRRTTNNILRRKLATKIEELKGDVVMMRRQIGLVEEEDEE